MLKTRILTALIMLAVLYGILAWAPVSAFAWFCLVLTGLAGWEWARLLGWQGSRAVAYGLAMVAATGAWFAAYQAMGTATPVRILWWLSAAFWLLGAPFALRQGVQTLSSCKKMGLAVMGAVILPACWFALTSAREISVPYLISVMLLVWAADVGAYFSGKAFGKRKLAPQISPGKSWEGAIGGGILVLVIAAVAVTTHWFAPTLYTRLVTVYGVVISVMVLIGLVGMSIVGDLFESLLKRQAGMKDSSQLLPGHGGILDRVDALLPVLPLAALLFL